MPQKPQPRRHRGAIPGGTGLRFFRRGNRAAIPQEVVRIGSTDDPDYGFSRISAVDADADGNVYVVERYDRQARVYSPVGELLQCMGGQGPGPGEFEVLERFSVKGDSVWAYDPAFRRWTMLDPEDQPIGEVRIPAGIRILPADAEAEDERGRDCRIFQAIGRSGLADLGRRHWTSIWDGARGVPSVDYTPLSGSALPAEASAARIAARPRSTIEESRLRTDR